MAASHCIYKPSVPHNNINLNIVISILYSLKAFTLSKCSALLSGLELIITNGLYPMAVLLSHVSVSHVASSAAFSISDVVQGYRVYKDIWSANIGSKIAVLPRKHK